MYKSFSFARAFQTARKRSLLAFAHLRRAVTRVNRLVTRRIGSPRLFIGRLGIITTCVTIFAPPATYVALATLQLQQRAAEQATLGARNVEVQLTRQHGPDWVNQVLINVVHATRTPHSVVVASWLTDTKGTTVMFQGQSAFWPEITAHMPVRAQQFEGRFYVAVTTRDIFVRAFQVAAVFLLVGLIAYYCFRRLPLAAIDHASRLLQAKQAELIAQKSQLETQNLRFDAALNNMSQGLCMFDGAQKLVVCNAPYVRMYRLSPELAKPGTPFAQIVERRVANGLHVGEAPEEYVRELGKIIADSRPATKIRELNDGRVLAIKHQPMPDGGWVSTHEDITDYRRIEARIAHMAHHDVLTELPNRLLLRERLQRAVDVAQEGKGLAVLCLDLDRFKDINDTLGHMVGDGLLKVVADRLRDCVGEGDTVARTGGDEFAVVQSAAEQPIAATALATRIIQAIDEPLEIDGHQVVVGTSIGIAVSPSDGTDPNQLLKSADLALYRAKSEGRGIYRFFEPEMDAHMQARCRLQLDLRKALANGEFELYYQPLVNLERDRVCGLEALLRWHHPERGNVSPAEFVPLAEETGLIVPIGEWVLRQACAAAAAWPDQIKVAVNLSAMQFKGRHLVETVFSALAASGLQAHRLELEITESILLQNNEATLATLHQLRALGVRIALDDFGTGYSSLSYLRSFPFDRIKIDRSFVKDIAEGAGSLNIVRAVTAMAAGLGMATTAEGVETREQLERVREEGCTEMQGYFFSPPRPIKDIERLLLSQVEAAANAA
jgi:diguanylate cyclase (GGDEF)-like protein